jgi:hypothetical protein
MWAYDFECDMTMEEIITVLNGAGPWTWIWREKDALGPYISSVPFAGARARIYDLVSYDSNGPTYTADFRLDERSEEKRSAIDSVFKQLSGKLAARHVRKGEGYD